MKSLKLCLFADLHHYPGVFYTQAAERLAAIQQRAEREQVDAIISLGDFCHLPLESDELLEQFHGFHIPSYMVLGNHDTDSTSLAEVLQAYRMPAPYYHFDLQGFRLIILDSNYLPESPDFAHSELGNHRDYPNAQAAIHPEELEFLRRSLEESPYPCLLFSHCSLERETGACLGNRDELMDILREAQRRRPGNLRLAVNGHHHRNFLRLLHGIAFLDLNSASYDWVSQAHDFFPESLCREFIAVQHTVVYQDALSAIVTLSQDGRISIEGAQSSMFMGVTREMTDNPAADASGRRCRPEILSQTFSLF